MQLITKYECVKLNIQSDFKQAREIGYLFKEGGTIWLSQSTDISI